MIDVKDLFQNDYFNKEVSISGWIRNHRKQKEFGFIDFNDGTYFKNLQIVYDNNLKDFLEIQKLHIGSAITVKGKIIKSEGSGQDIEMKLISYVLEGDCPEDYPIQPKRHTKEFLREQAYLRMRTNLFGAVFRVRSVAAYAIHKYFQDNGYVYFHAPLITAADAEGAGEMFQVTTLDLDRIAKDGKVDYSKDFFGSKASLTVSGQLQAETFALAYKKTYTFGPTFRAENSNTKTHASEFWMIEPEISFCDLDGDMDIMEEMLKYVVKYVLDNCPNEMEFFDKFVEKDYVKKSDTYIFTLQNGDRAELSEYAENVIIRFSNPYIDHKLSAIKLNSVSKFRYRVLPSIISYREKFGAYPKALVFGFSKLIEYYKKCEPSDEKYAVDFIKSNSVRDILSNAELWGENIYTARLEKMICDGMNTVKYYDD